VGLCLSCSCIQRGGNVQTCWVPRDSEMVFIKRRLSFASFFCEPFAGPTHTVLVGMATIGKLSIMVFYS